MVALKTCLSLLATTICSAFYVKSEGLITLNRPGNIEGRIPIVLNTWDFTNATQKAWVTLNEGQTAVDAIVAGCGKCEEEQCDGTVGFGGSPDENGETTLDAMIMDGVTHDVGAVAGLRRIKNAIGVARAVMQYTKHTLLVGELATDFAKQMGFDETSLQTNHSKDMWKKWKQSNCQPNYRQNVHPDPTKSCGPYRPNHLSGSDVNSQERINRHVSKGNHDTIGMLIVDQQGNVAAGTSTNGASHKIPGRVGDSPIMGAGAYVDNDVGAAAATGDGDVMMRFLPSFKAVELMRQGKSPSEACQEAAKEIARYYPEYSGAVIAVTLKGVHGAGCHGLSSFEYSVRSADLKNVTVINVPCMK